MRKDIDDFNRENKIRTRKHFFNWIKRQVLQGHVLEYTYCTTELWKPQRLFKDLVYLELNGERLYFKETVTDNSAARDCDVRFTYTPTSKDAIEGQFKEVLAKL
jgi:hypothetical protein